MRKFEIIVILLLIVIIGGGLYWLNKDNSISMQQEGKTTLSPTQIKSIEAIGQWEFLSISDEELIDTVRKGLISDDELVRIYYGTLRLGINMREVGTEWLSAEGDTIICTLPPIRLLDRNFIDEAKTRSFFEEGKWTGKDLQDMYKRAYEAMSRRCFTKANIAKAEENAKAQFEEMFQAMGYSNVRIKIEHGIIKEKDK